MEREIYYACFNLLEPVPFEVLEVTDETLRIRLLEDGVPSKVLEDILQRNPPRMPIPSAGKEYLLPNKLRSGDSIIDRLRSGGVAPYIHNLEIFGVSSPGSVEGELLQSLFFGNLYGFDRYDPVHKKFKPLSFL